MKQVFAALCRYALDFPETREDLPWGESAIKVGGKAFLFMRLDDNGLHLSVKLPRSALYALDRQFCTPTGYGLGASGWVTAEFGPKAKPPVALLKSWIEESYGAIAPKKRLAQPRKPAKSAMKRPSNVNSRATPRH